MQLSKSERLLCIRHNIEDGQPLGQRRRPGRNRLPFSRYPKERTLRACAASSIISSIDHFGLNPSRFLINAFEVR